MSTLATVSTTAPRQHGIKGVYYGGEWLDMEDCDGRFSNLKNCSGCPDFGDKCPRSRSHNTNADSKNKDYYDVLIIGAGCVGSCLAREISKFDLRILWVEAADDVSQGATKGNSGIVHAGYDDEPGTNRAKYCWKGNQMFASLDKELRFGYQKNGSLVVAFTEAEKEILLELKKRGEINGVQHLKIVQDRKELFEMEPHLHPEAIAALHAPEAGNVIPYEFAIALAENAVDNGVQLRIRRHVTSISSNVSTSSSEERSGGCFQVQMNHWEPGDYVRATTPKGVFPAPFRLVLRGLFGLVLAQYVAGLMGNTIFPYFTTSSDSQNDMIHTGFWAVMLVLALLDLVEFAAPNKVTKNTPIEVLVRQAREPRGKSGSGPPVQVQDMLVGGSGSSMVLQGKVVETETVTCRFIINCAGGASDQIARMIGDDSFQIKPRLGDYLLLNRNQGHLAKHTLFPCPDPVLGKGVLVQTTLWGNLILGPTARDMHKPEAREMSPAAVQEYILGKCKKLVPSFDAKETIHAFCGARAKSNVGDWIIGPSPKNPNMIHVAGIDSPGLAGAPAIAVDVVQMLQTAGLKMTKNPSFNPNRAPIITPKDGMKGLKMGPVGKFDSDGRNMAQMAQNVICKCEKVTELEVVRALRRSLPIDSSQAIRKRTRAGMGHCQGDPDNYNCEARVRAIIARENGVPVDQVGGRPWPATSTLSERWIGDQEKQHLQDRKDRAS